jgi:hypothetical protein
MEAGRRQTVRVPSFKIAALARSMNETGETAGCSVNEAERLA